MSDQTLAGRLAGHAAARPASLALRFLDGEGVPVEVSYAELDLRSRALAARLNELVPEGGRAILLLPSGIDYAVAFFACLHAGVIAVPAYPPGSSRASQDQRLRGMMLDAQPTVILATRQAFPAIENWGGAEGIALLAVEDVPAIVPTGWRPAVPDPAAIAFLQYTSGSTARPKGVCVTHANLLANEAAMAAAFNATSEDVGVSWLPFYHDMGLIGGLLLPLHVGYPVTLMPPGRFLERPRRWLEAISRFGGTISGGPDFAFRLAVERISDAVLGGLDLRRWRVAFSGSEPVRAATLDRFARRFEPAGFDARALNPCYGLAEATLFVTGAQAMCGASIISLDPALLGRGEAVPADGGLRVVGCGETRSDHALRIVRGKAAVGDGVVGDIQIAGPSLAQGYWRNEAATRDAYFDEEGRRWLRTGDLGFLRDGMLHVTGRRKDMLIIRGQNIYPQDVEQAIEEAFEPARRGRIAVFPVEAQGREAIGVAVEISALARRKASPATLAEAIGRIVLRHCDEFPVLVALLPPHVMPMTTSGKLQRSACAAGLADGTLDAFAVLEGGKLREPEAATPAPSEATLQTAIAAIWCQALDREAVAPGDDFFMLGGSSISVAEVVAAIQDRFGITIDPRLLFDLPRLDAFAARVAALLAAAGPPASAPAVLPPGTPLPLSHAQERLWFLWQMEPAGTAYNLACVVRLQGDLDPARLQQALALVVQRHAVLRTTFHAGEERPRQQVQDQQPLVLHRQDLAGEDRDAAIARRIAADLATPFDLAAGPLLRAALLRFADDDHALLLGAHHIVADGLSMGVLLDDLAGFYRAPDAAMPPLPIQFGDHARWQRDWLGAGEQQRQLAYWRTALGDEHPVLTLPLDRPRPATQSHRGAVLHERLDPALTAALERIAARHQATLPMLLLTAYQLLLHRHAGQEEVRIGIPVANRQHTAAMRLVGCFVNTLVFPGRLDGAARLPELLARNRRLMLDALAHQDLPFEALVDALQVPRSLAHNPLFQAKFNHMVAPTARDMAAGLRAVMQQPAQGGAHFDLALDVTQDAAGLDLAFSYATEILGPATIGRMAADFVALLRMVAVDADLSLRALPWPASPSPPIETRAFPQATLLPLLTAGATMRPSAAAAVVCGTAVLTHGELSLRSNRLAHGLLARGVGAEARIGICADRSAGFVTALLGVLKAGAAYVPLDPSWPAARLAQVAADAGLALVLADGAGVAALQKAGIAATALEDPALLAGQPEEPPAVDLHPGQTAYVIYTSGSTGQPKGVAVSHGALAHYVQAMLHRLHPAAGAMAMVSTPAADLGHTVLFGALATGATLHLLDAASTGDAEAFARRMREGVVDVLKIVPGHLRGLLQAHEGAAVLPHSLLILGGEASDPALVAEVRRRRPACRIVNHYGPTETTVGVLTHEVAAAVEGVIPVGRPLANLRAHVLDAALQPVPAGVAGELYLGGPQLARGYLGQPGLTAERFVPDAYGAPGERLYRTGDRVVRGGDDLIRFLGRVDEQVKIRGYRVEPGEVARVLRQQPGVLDAVVLARSVQPEDRLHLVAYCVAETGTPLQVEALKAQLAVILPDYMVPAQIMLLDRLPLTPNGKIDRKALPTPEQGGTADLALPQGPVEEALAEVWQQVLRVDKVGRADNFFELGGDSILSLQVIARLRKRGIQLTPKQIFEKQTIRQLASVAVSASGEAAAPAMAGPLPLLPIQHRFFGEVLEDRHHWNQAVLLRPRTRLDWDRVEAALLAVAGQHEALRLRFREGEAGWVAEPGPMPEGAALLWRREAADGAGVTALCEAAQRSLDLSAGPLLRAVGMDLADGSQRLLVVIHHLVVDGVSWRVLLEDLQAGYGGQALPAGTESYAQWSARLHGLAGELDGELGWWQAQQAAGELPCDRVPEGPDHVGDAEVVSLELDAGVTRALLREAPAAYRTQVNDLLLAALARSVGGWSGQDAVLVELEGHGREDVFAGADVSRTVGWFTTAYPVLLPVVPETGALIRQTKERLRSVPQRGLGYGVLRYLGTPEQRAALSGLPVPRITFNYLGQFDGSFGEAALLAPAAESAGAARSAKAPLGRWLTINGRVYEGRLRLGWSYSRRRYDRATVERLAAGFGAALREIVAHCGNAPLGLTPSDVPLSGLDQQQLDGLALDAGQVEEIYPLSPMQQGMLFHSLQDAGSGIYVNQLSVEIGGLDGARLRTAWQLVSDRHAILRTGFVWQGLPGGAQQVVHRRVAVPFAEADWRGRVIDPAALQAVAEAERAAGFDLAQPPLQRVLLIRLDDDRHQLIWTRHHILTDGWSSARLIGEILNAYHGQSLPAAPARYRDYIAWLQTRDRKAAEQFWREQLRGLDAPTLLASSLGAAPAGAGHAMCHTRLDEAETERLQAFARRERITLNTLIQGAWALLLRRYTGQEAVSFGATVAGRPAVLPGVEETVGLFINTLPVVLRPQPSSTVGDWLRAVQAQNLALREFEETPLYDIQGWAGYAGQPLFDSIIVFENYPADRGLQQRAERPLRFANLTTIDVTNYPMDLSVLVDATLVVEYTYMLSHFSAAQAEQIRAQFEHLLLGLASDASRSLADMRPETEGDCAAIARCNAGAVACANRPLVHEAIAAHALRDPDSIALIIGETELTYGTLDARANRLASHLIAQGVGPDTLVGVIVHRTAATMVALLAVLKAGGAYVPLDPEYPADRLSFIIRDACIGLLLGEPPAGLDIPLGMRVVDHTRLDLTGTAATAPRPMLADQNLAYLIYTSGSTGQPKGVAVTHGPLAMHCIATGALYEIDASACEAHFLSLAFDGAHERWLTVLTHGARLVMRDATLWTPEQTCAVLHRHRATHIGLPPAYLQQLAEWVERDGNPPPVKLYSFGGEAMPQAGFDRVRRVLAPQILINGYGPTETVVTPLVWKVDAAADCAAAYAPIGMPVGDRQAYILDADLNLVPAGIAGELYIGGSGLARGYHGRPGLTAERFVPDPFAAAPGGRLYRTGDLVRCGDDGQVEYLGRLDDQVKIRGYRIELGEVQSRLTAHPAIRQATVVAAAAPEGSRLIGYVTPLVPGTDADRLAETVTADLKRELPDYMIPARIMVLAAMPMMPNGKVDRHALPEPAWGSEEHVPPATEAEARMAAIWADVLELERVGVTDNFFELGGNSLLSLRVIGRLRQEAALGVEIKLRDLMRKPTIRALLAGVGSSDRPMARLPLNLAVPGTPPVFCLHGGLGTVFDYIPLARRLEGRRQVIGLQSRMLVDRGWTDASLAAMAQDYAQEIRQIQPEGPYHLLGWSLGGMLAALTAAALEREGQRVGLLALVDSTLPNASEASRTDWLEALRAILAPRLPDASRPRLETAILKAREAGRPESEMAVEGIIAAVLDALPPDAARSSLEIFGGGQGAGDLARAFIIGRHLRDLVAAAGPFPALRAGPRCWWTGRRGEAWHLPDARDEGTVGDDHFAILSDPLWLDAICGILLAEAMAGQEADPAE